MTLKVAFVSRDPAIRLAGAKALERAPAGWTIVLVEEAAPDADVVVCGPDARDCRGIPFDPARPDALLSSIAAATRRASVIAVAGACGGCGVTTVALHLARSYRECFVECHPHAGAAERLGLDRTAIKTWDADAATDEGNRLAALPMAGGFRALFSSPRPLTADEVIRASAACNRNVVLDIPAGHVVPARCDALVLVTPPTRPGAARSRAFLEQVPPSLRRAVITNRQGPGGELTRAEMERLVRDRIVLELPCSAALRDAEDEAELLPPRSPWARRVAALADALTGSARVSRGGAP